MLYLPKVSEVTYNIIQPEDVTFELERSLIVAPSAKITGKGTLKVGLTTEEEEVIIEGTILELQAVLIHVEEVNITTTSNISVLSYLEGMAPGNNGVKYRSGGGAHGGSAVTLNYNTVLPPYGSFAFPSLPGSKGGASQFDYSMGLFSFINSFRCFVYLYLLFCNSQLPRGTGRGCN